MGLERLKESDGVNDKVSVVPVMVLCDNSGTMSKFVHDTRRCLKNMVTGLKKRPSQASSIDLCIATFNTNFEVLVPFTRLGHIADIPEIEPSDLATFLGMAVSKSVELLAAEKEKLKKAEIEYCQPTLIVLSDGLPEHEKEDVTAAGIKAIQDKISTERWNCIPILIGQEFANRKTVLAELAPPDENGIRQEFKFSSDDQISNLAESLKFASASISLIAEINGNTTNELYARFKQLNKLRCNHKFLQQE